MLLHYRNTAVVLISQLSSGAFIQTSEMFLLRATSGRPFFQPAGSVFSLFMVDWVMCTQVFTLFKLGVTKIHVCVTTTGHTNGHAGPSVRLAGLQRLAGVEAGPGQRVGLKAPSLAFWGSGLKGEHEGNLKMARKGSGLSRGMGVWENQTKQRASGTESPGRNYEDTSRSRVNVTSCMTRHCTASFLPLRAAPFLTNGLVFCLGFMCDVTILTPFGMTMLPSAGSQDGCPGVG